MRKNPGEKPRKTAAQRRAGRLSGHDTAGQWMATVLLLLSAAIGLTALLLLIGTQDFSRPRFSSYFHEPMLLLLNFVPVALLVAFCYFATNRAWLAFLLPGVPLFIMAFVGYFKIVLRGDPLVAEDFLTVGEGAGMLGQYEFHFPLWFYIGVVLLIGGAVVLCCCARARVPRRLWWLRLVALALALCAGWAAWTQWYTDDELYESQKNYSFFNEWKDAEKYGAHGFVYGFLHSLHNALPTPPEGYSRAKAEALLDGYADAAIPEEKRVNVVATMLESFSDLSVFDTIHFTADPYEAFHALQAESYHGTLIVDTVGGGTNNAERSFLTGFTYPHPRYDSATSSYVRYFAAQGYQTDGAHPGFDWFYSRANINRRLGFDRYLFMENHFNALTDEEHALDDVFFPEMARVYDEETADGQPYFSFSVSYQNHSPYDETTLLGQEYVSHEGISDATYAQVNNYLNGIADTSRRVSAYVDSFRDNPEPVVLLFFGDHRPSFGVGNCRYEEMGISAAEGSAEGCANLFTTPYLIWANDAAKAALGFQFTGEGHTISPAFLMTELFDCCGWEGPAWMQFQRRMRDEIPVIHKQFLFLVDGVLTSDLTGDRQELLQNYRIVEYDMRKHLRSYED